LSKKKKKGHPQIVDSTHGGYDLIGLRRYCDFQLLRLDEKSETFLFLSPSRIEAIVSNFFMFVWLLSNKYSDVRSGRQALGPATALTALLYHDSCVCGS
jgi:hypothetical protein